MISIAICIVIVGALYIAFEYLSNTYEVLAGVAPWFGYIAIGLMVLAAALMIFQMVLDIRRNTTHLFHALIAAGVAAVAYIVMIMISESYSYLDRYENWALYLLIGYGAGLLLQCIAQIVKMIRREVKEIKDERGEQI